MLVRVEVRYINGVVVSQHRIVDTVVAQNYLISETRVISFITPSVEVTLADDTTQTDNDTGITWGSYQTGYTIPSYTVLHYVNYISVPISVNPIIATDPNIHLTPAPSYIHTPVPHTPIITPLDQPVPSSSNPFRNRNLLNTLPFREPTSTRAVSFSSDIRTQPSTPNIVLNEPIPENSLEGSNNSSPRH
jgi:hypothetical protein